MLFVTRSCNIFITDDSIVCVVLCFYAFYVLCLLSVLESASVSIHGESIRFNSFFSLIFMLLFTVRASRVRIHNK